MWKIMMFGRNPFTLTDGQLSLRLQPMIPAYLVPDDKEVSAMLLSTTKVTYKLADQKDYFPGEYKITGMELTYKNGSHATVNGDTLGADIARDVRDGEVESILATLA